MAFFIYDPNHPPTPYTESGEWRKVKKSDSSEALRRFPVHTPVQDIVERSRSWDDEEPKKRSPQAAPAPGVIYANQIMKRPVITLSEEASIEEAWRLFIAKRFRHIPIVSATGQLAGLLSDRTIAKYLVETKRRSKTEKRSHLVKDLMVSSVLTSRPFTDIAQISKVFIDERIGSMPILDEYDQLVGILTRSDILRTLLHVAPYDLRG